MFGMFDGLGTDNIFNQDIGKLGYIKSDKYEKMFHNCPPFNQDIGNWDVSSVTIWKTCLTLHKDNLIKTLETGMFQM